LFNLALIEKSFEVGPLILVIMPLRQQFDVLNIQSEQPEGRVSVPRYTYDSTPTALFPPEQRLVCEGHSGVISSLLIKAALKEPEAPHDAEL
jgi:hypothetical protein